MEALGISLRDIIILIEFKFTCPSLACHTSKHSTFATREEMLDILLIERGIRLNLNKPSQM